MVKRNIPFGYEMASGDIVICELEAEAVRLIFSLYLQGASLSEIAGAMTVPYNEGAAWDKHKVKRVLDNPRYLGTDSIPPLIGEDDYAAANRLKSEKNVSVPLPCSDDIQPLKASSFCHGCGGRFIRKVNRHGRPRWKCVDSGCENTVVLDDEEIKLSVATAINSVIDNPGVLLAGQPIRPVSLAVTKLQNEVNREMSKIKPDVEQTQNLLLSLAAEKYASCADSRADAAFRAIFKNHRPAAQFDRGLFDAAVDKVFIDGGGAALLRLKNGQTVPDPDHPRKEILPC